MNFMNNNNNNNNNPYAGGAVYDPFATQLNGNTNNQNMYNTNNIGPNTAAPTNNVYQNTNVRAPYLDPGPVFTAVAFDARPYVRFSSYNIPAFTGYVLDSPKLKAAKDIIVMILNTGIGAAADNMLYTDKSYVCSLSDNSSLTIKIKVELKSAGNTIPALYNEVTSSNELGLGSVIDESYFRANPNILQSTSIKSNYKSSPDTFVKDFIQGLSNYIDTISNYINDSMYRENDVMVMPYALKIFMETSRLEYGPIAIRPTLTIINNNWIVAFGYELTPDVTMKLKSDTRF